MKIRRDVASIPVRSAGDTWRTIVELVSDSDSAYKKQLDAAASIIGVQRPLVKRKTLPG